MDNLFYEAIDKDGNKLAVGSTFTDQYDCRRIVTEMLPTGFKATGGCWISAFTDLVIQDSNGVWQQSGEKNNPSW